MRHARPRLNPSREVSSINHLILVQLKKTILDRVQLENSLSLPLLVQSIYIKDKYTFIFRIAVAYLFIDHRIKQPLKRTFSYLGDAFDQRL